MCHVWRAKIVFWYLQLLDAGARANKVSGHQHRWVEWCLYPVIRAFLEVARMVVTWWIVAFCAVLPSLCKQRDINMIK